MEHITVGAILALGLNFLPLIIAGARRHNSAIAIAITWLIGEILLFVGLFTGVALVISTILWFWCLIWSLTGNTQGRDEKMAKMLAMSIKGEGP